MYAPRFGFMLVGLLACGLLTCTPASADQDPPRIDAWLVQVLKLARGSREREAVQRAAYRKWDTELNRVYLQTLQGLNREERTAAVQAERAWIAYRDAEWRTLSLLASDFPATLDETGERIELTRQRTRQLYGVLHAGYDWYDKTTYSIDRWQQEAEKNAMDEAGISQLLTTAAGKWDSELNRGFRRLKSKLKPRTRLALVKSQTAWLRFRDADNNGIEAVSLHRSPNDQLDDSGFGVMNVHLHLIRARVLQLQRYKRTAS